MPDLYREAVAPSSPTLPLSGYVGYRRMKEDTTPIGVETDWNLIPRVAAAATLGWRSQPLRGTWSEAPKHRNWLVDDRKLESNSGFVNLPL